MIALAGAAAAAEIAGADASPGKPRPVSFDYALDADAGRAFWVSDRKTAGQPQDTIFAAAQPVKARPRFLGEDGVLARAAAAPPLPLPGPDVALVGDTRVNGRRELTVRVSSRRGAPWLHVFVESGKFLSATVDDAPFQTTSAGADVADGNPWGFRSIGADEEGFVLKLVVGPAAGQVRITAVDQSAGIDHPLGRLPSDAMYARSWIAGTTLVRSSRAF